MSARLCGLILAGAALLAGCGTRVPGDEVRAGVRGGEITVALPERSLHRPAVESESAVSAAAPPMEHVAPVPLRVASKPHVPRPASVVAGAGSSPARARPTPPPSGTRATTAVASTGDKAAAAAACTTPGLPVILGQVGSFSGLAGPITSGARTAMAVWAKDVNARGGVACHPVVLHSVDDAAEAARSAALVQELARYRKAVALVGSFTVLSMVGFRPAVEAERIPAVGGDVLSADWNDSPYLFPQGAGFDAVIYGLLRQAVAGGRTNIGLLYCVEAAACTTGAKTVEAETVRAGGRLAYSSAISLTQMDFTAQCQNAKNAAVEVLGLAMEGSAMARVARSCAALGYRPQFAASGLIISPAQGEDSNLRQNTLTTASVNAPWMREDTPGQRAYHRALAAYAPDAVPDASSITAWASGKLFEAAIARLGAEAREGPITTALVLKGLGLIRNETLDGLAPPITFAPGQPRAPLIRCVYYELLTTEGWTAPRGSRPICD